MSWEAEIAELRRREELARRMGGAEKVKRQHDGGKLTVRERIDRLLDAGTFHEIGAIAGRGQYDANGDLVDFSPTNFVFGRGRINGRPVVVGGDDFTVRGGAADASIWQKQVHAEQMARELRIPMIRLVDGTGGGGSVKSLDMDGRTYVPMMPGWDHVVANLSTVPVVSLALGSVAGLGAARAVSSHLCVMVEGISQMFIAGPPVVARTGVQMTKEELGGAEIHMRAGAADLSVATEDEAFEAARRFLSYLPQSVYDLPPRVTPQDDVNRREEKLLSIVPRDRRRVYKMRDILDMTLDAGSFFEIGRLYGRSVITGLARLDGWPVAVLASDPYHYGGGWTADSSHKITRFVDLAETFHLPVVHFVDIPGFLIGPEAEQAGTIRHGARALAAVYQATVPWCSIIVRKAFGVAGAGHSNHARLHYRYAWPSGDWGSLPLEGGIEAAYRAELEKADDPAALLKQIEDRLNKVRSPFRTAEAFLVEEIIDPRDTRPLLCEFANLAAPLRRPGVPTFGYRP
ncbi:carboxyl transferase domain-containing protein [uncultured Ferrovibrio sp.]|jgi:acetyl-CoA carboxylase carboxyltransferase component|uniref:acyl-CoA carboxylase subunit beta n=1 Tax=uncultured Ferrovibrio sp. TaxID=1576913 RepID=UPI00262C5342|nr:carboxyl transferase domain-containing protein [uncultured Ferrovibrio sp.]